MQLIIGRANKGMGEVDWESNLGTLGTKQESDNAR
jgi:hypothetical protein